MICSQCCLSGEVFVKYIRAKNNDGSVPSFDHALKLPTLFVFSLDLKSARAHAVLQLKLLSCFDKLLCLHRGRWKFKISQDPNKFSPIFKGEEDYVLTINMVWLIFQHILELIRHFAAYVRRVMHITKNTNNRMKEGLNKAEGKHI